MPEASSANHTRLLQGYFTVLPMLSLKYSLKGWLHSSNWFQSPRKCEEQPNPEKSIRFPSSVSLLLVTKAKFGINCGATNRTNNGLRTQRGRTRWKWDAGEVTQWRMPSVKRKSNISISTFLTGNIPVCEKVQSWNPKNRAIKLKNWLIWEVLRATDPARINTILYIAY